MTTCFDPFIPFPRCCHVFFATVKKSGTFAIESGTGMRFEFENKSIRLYNDMIII